MLNVLNLLFFNRRNRTRAGFLAALNKIVPLRKETKEEKEKFEKEEEEIKHQESVYNG